VPGFGLVPAPPVPGLVPEPPVVVEEAPPWPLGVELLPPAAGLPEPLPPVLLCEEGAGVAVELEQPTSAAKTAKDEMRPTEPEAK